MITTEAKEKGSNKKALYFFLLFENMGPQFSFCTGFCKLCSLLYDGIKILCDIEVQN